jgi:hypothetical protein
MLKLRFFHLLPILFEALIDQLWRILFIFLEKRNLESPWCARSLVMSLVHMLILSWNTILDTDFECFFVNPRCLMIFCINKVDFLKFKWSFALWIWYLQLIVYLLDNLIIYISLVCQWIKKVFSIKRIKISMKPWRYHSMSCILTTFCLENSIRLIPIEIKMNEDFSAKCSRPKLKFIFTPSFTNPAVVFNL